jgi:tripartite-type tricarboxylate transporter receptor subunit TctC
MTKGETVMLTRRHVLLGAGAALTTATRAQGQAAWPSRPVTVIVPFGAGGTSDLLARLITPRLSARLGQQFVVENRAGAAGNVGVGALARATPDGYTVGMSTVSAHAINPHLYRERLGFDPIRDFYPLTMVATQPNMLVIHPSIPAENLAQFIAYLKANPGKESFASSGVGTSIHLAGELFKIMAGVDMEHVAYRSSGEIMQNLLGAHVKVAFDNFSSAWPHVQAGRLRGLAVTSRERNRIAPNMPSVHETLPGFEAVSWHGFFAPAAVPRPILDRLSAQARAVIAEPEINNRIRELGAEPSGNSPDEFMAFIRAEIAKWGPVVEKARVTVN